MSNKYLELAKLSTNYATRMNRLSNRLFGEVVRPTNAKSMKVVKILAIRPDHMKTHKVDYYPRHEETYWLMRHLRDYGLFRDEHQDFNDEMKRLRALRGKTKGRKPKQENKE